MLVNFFYAKDFKINRYSYFNRIDILLSRFIHNNNNNNKVKGFINEGNYINSELVIDGKLGIKNIENFEIKKDSLLLLTQFKNDSINRIMNKSNIDPVIVKDIEDNLLKLFILIEIIRKDFNPDDISKIKNDIFNYLEKLGGNKTVIKKEFKEYVNNMNNNFILDSNSLIEYNGYLEDINSIVLSKCNGLSIAVENKLKHCLKLTYEFNIQNIDKHRRNMICNIITKLKEEAKTESIIRGRRGR